MDITQIAIKINQTNLSNREKSNLTTKMEDPVISFDQVLSMFNLEQSVKSPIQNGSDQNGIVQTDSQTPSKEDLSNLDSILTTWVAAIQQVQNWPATEGVKSTDQSSGSEVSDTPGVTNVASQLQQLTTEGTEELAQWLQKVNGQKSSTLDPRMLLQEITKIIANPETPEQPKAIVDKIQIIMNELESENNFGFLFADKKSDPNLESKMGLSLDKNQALVSYIPGPLKRIIGENSSTSSTSSSQMEDLTKSTGMSSMINQQQGSIGMNESTVETVPSQLTVSEFAPEVSEWIGRYIRISGGQSGSTEAKFSLYPEHLGHIEIKITSQQGQIAAQIITDTSMAKD
ncbi:MAG TPA: flagellar hook-length control protein FliK, partial [Neobacillus sp.]